MAETHTVLSVLLRVVCRTDNMHLHVTVALSTGGKEGIFTRGQICYNRQKKGKRKSVSGCVRQSLCVGGSGGWN